jgi:putative transposase
MVRPAEKEQCVEYAIVHYPISYSRACNLFSSSRSHRYYPKKMPQKDEPVLKAIKSAMGNDRRGRKKVIVLVQRKDPQYSSFKIRRVYEKAGYALQVKPSRKRTNSKSNPATLPTAKNEEWAIDFMSDALVNGRQIRSLNIIDPFNRNCNGMYIEHSIPARRLIELLQRSIEAYGKPAAIRTDNGPEFISKRFQLWLKDNHIRWQPIAKGKPQENCFIERFNRTAREEFFNANLLLSIEDANEKAAKFIHQYNTVRPHESLNNKTPLEYAA